MTFEKHSQGATFKGYLSTLGFILIIAGGGIFYKAYVSDFFFLLSIAISSLLIVIGFILFLSIRGVLIDYYNRKIKSYVDCFIFKIGSWKTVVETDKLMLKYFNESQKMHYKSISSNIQTRTFDIFIKSEDNKELLIREFTKYDKALSFMIEFSKKINISYVDTYEILKQRIQERKRTVR